MVYDAEILPLAGAGENARERVAGPVAEEDGR
jgi:hypothetical protein